MLSWLYVVLPLSFLDLGIVKRFLVACLVGYAWVSELCASRLNRQLGTLSLSTFLTKTKSISEVNLSSSLRYERLTCISLMLASHVLLRVSRAARSETILIFGT
jgi:hypothetical protein